MKKSLNPHEVYVQRRRTYIQRRQTKLSYPKKIYRCPKKFTYRWQYGIHSPWWNHGYSIGLLKRLIVFTFYNNMKKERRASQPAFLPLYSSKVWFITKKSNDIWWLHIIFQTLQSTRVVWQANVCTLQKLEPLLNHYLHWDETLINRSF